MQALVDSNYIFRDIVVGTPGSVHNTRIFSNSQLYALGCSGRLFPSDVKEETAYPMLNWRYLKVTQRMLIPPGFRCVLIIASVEPG